MKKTTIMRLSIAGLGFSLLVGCSSFPMAEEDDATNRVAVVRDEPGATSSGIGQQAAFDGEEVNNGQGMGGTFSTKAPMTQTYYYAFDNDKVNGKYLQSIKAQARYLLSHPGAHILLSGHTDERGSREYNVALGERRSKSVYNYLTVTMGVSPKQIRVVSYGQQRPAIEGHNEAAYRWNRRVVLSYEATA